MPILITKSKKTALHADVVLFCIVLGFTVICLVAVCLLYTGNLVLCVSIAYGSAVLVVLSLYHVASLHAMAEDYERFSTAPIKVFVRCGIIAKIYTVEDIYEPWDIWCVGHSYDGEYFVDIYNKKVYLPDTVHVVPYTI